MQHILDQLYENKNEGIFWLDFACLPLEDPSFLIRRLPFTVSWLHALFQAGGRPENVYVSLAVTNTRTKPFVKKVKRMKQLFISFIAAMKISWTSAARHESCRVHIQNACHFQVRESDNSVLRNQNDRLFLEMQPVILSNDCIQEGDFKYRDRKPFHVAKMKLPLGVHTAPAAIIYILAKSTIKRDGGHLRVM